MTQEWVFGHEPGLRLGASAAVFAAMVLWELVAERRALTQSRPRRWLANFGLSVVDGLLVRLLFPTAAVGVALLVEREGWGLLVALGTGGPAAVLLSVLVLDLVVYLQHRLFHAVPLLWRLHRVHHTDQDLDATSGIRFHPVEILLSMGIKVAAIAVLGAPALAVLLFEILLNATSIFNHGNVRVPGAIEGTLRWLVVTPDMHRVHHSVLVDEANSNFGFNLPWWDRLFGTYRAEPRGGHAGMRLGVRDLEVTRPRGLLGLLKLPFEGRRSRDRASQ